jgi:hypothetical protein
MLLSRNENKVNEILGSGLISTLSVSVNSLCLCRERFARYFQHRDTEFSQRHREHAQIRLLPDFAPVGSQIGWALI